MNIRKLSRFAMVMVALLATTITASLAPASAASPRAPRRGSQSNASFAGSYAANKVMNVVATVQKTSCFRPEVPYSGNLGPLDGYTGESACNGKANTGEDIGTSPYPTQIGSNPGYPADKPMLVKDHSESDIRVDPTNPSHLIGQSKWFVSAEGYNHLLGFYESFDGGVTWSVQGHIPGYEGWTDNTDPVGAFDGFGNFYSLVLPYQFFYNKDGGHNFTVGNVKEPNPNVPAEVISVAVRPHGAKTATDWITTHGGRLDIVASYDSVGREPDKQWIAIDTNQFLPNHKPNPNYNTIYAMWALFNGGSAKPFVSTAKALADGSHTDWSAPQLLPTVSNSAGDTYLLPHVDPAGVVWTTVTNFPGKGKFCCATISVDFSTDGGKTWQGPLIVVQKIPLPPGIYTNTTFRDGIEDTFAVGNQLSQQGSYPLYVSWEDYSAGVTNLLLSASYDAGHTWTTPILVNDNSSPVDEFQTNLNVAPNGAVSVAFYDRRLPCPAKGTGEALGAGLKLDTANPNYSGPLPPYGATNYCVNSAIQFYSPTLQPFGQNIRTSAHTWDPQLNSPHAFGISNIVTFIGDYYGNTSNGQFEFTTSVSTFNGVGAHNDNPHFYQQQVIAGVAVPKLK